MGLGAGFEWQETTSWLEGRRIEAERLRMWPEG